MQDITQTRQKASLGVASKGIAKMDLVPYPRVATEVCRGWQCNLKQKAAQKPAGGPVKVDGQVPLIMRLAK